MNNSSLNNQYLVESYTNGDSWYRVYNDGYCEQGGFIDVTSSGVTITFLKEYKNANYSVIATSTEENGSGYYGFPLENRTARTNKTCQLATVFQGYWQSGQITWFSCGYIS